MTTPAADELGRILIIIPTYNEAENVVQIVTRARSAVPQADVLVADDHSPDGTGKLADELAAQIVGGGQALGLRHALPPPLVGQGGDIGLLPHHEGARGSILGFDGGGGSLLRRRGSACGWWWWIF